MNDLDDIKIRVELLEKWRSEHLGPKKGASSLNIPHTNAASGTDLAALTVRVVSLEAAVASLQASVATLQSSVSTLQTQMTAVQAAANTAGRYN